MFKTHHEMIVPSQKTVKGSLYKKQSEFKKAKQNVLKKYQYRNDLGHCVSSFELDIHDQRAGEWEWKSQLLCACYSRKNRY